MTKTSKLKTFVHGIGARTGPGTAHHYISQHGRLFTSKTLTAEEQQFLRPVYIQQSSRM